MLCTLLLLDALSGPGVSLATHVEDWEVQWTHSVMLLDSQGFIGPTGAGQRVKGDR